MALIFFFSAQSDLSTGLGVWDLVDRKVVHAASFRDAGLPLVLDALRPYPAPDAGRGSDQHPLCGH
jgi:hypothetical protein